jgi:hypothetical protein
MRPAALNTAGTTEGRPIPKKTKPAIAAAGRPIASPAANPAVAAAARTGRRRDGLKRLSSRLPDNRTVTIAREGSIAQARHGASRVKRSR